MNIEASSNINREGNTSEVPTLCDPCVRFQTIIIAAYFSPAFLFALDLSNKNWVDSASGKSMDSGLHWKHSTYFIVTALCGAVGGVVASAHPERVHMEWIAGLFAGLLGSPIGLAVGVLYLNHVSSYNFYIHLFITMVGGGLSRYCVYKGIKEVFILPRETTVFAQIENNTSIV